MDEKLIRDKIELDDDAVTRQAAPEELESLLGRKLVEEAEELAQVLKSASGSGLMPGETLRQIIDEAADVMEVMNTILWRLGIDTYSLARRMEIKRNARGGFTDRVLINPKPSP